MLVIGLLIISYITVKKFKNRDFDQRTGINALILGIIFAILGARIFYVLLNYQTFSFHLIKIFKLWDGGFGILGGMIGASGICWLYLKWRGLNVWRFADILAPQLGLFIFFTRIGCFLNGCDFGKPTSLPVGVRFPRGLGAYAVHLFQGKINLFSKYSLPVHPTQLYESAFGLLFFLFAYFYLEKKTKFDGELFWIFVLSYGIFRFVTDFFRYYPPREIVFSLAITQWTSIVFVIFSAFFLASNRIKKIHNQSNLHCL